jgi:ABC-type Zn uptake system ZnuABC Zn-binding protein ZnuA
LDVHDGEDGGEDGHGGVDPHIWLDPRFAVIQVRNIAEGLAAHDPENAEFYRRNAEAYVRSLEALDAEIARDTAAFTKKDFVAFHPAFSYFARRYGLNQAAVIEEFPGQEPSPRYVAGVMRTIRDLGVTAIFAEPQFSPRIVEVIARDLDIDVRVLDPIETGDPDKDSYLRLMRANLEALRSVLQ